MHLLWSDKNLLSGDIATFYTANVKFVPSRHGSLEFRFTIYRVIFYWCRVSTPRIGFVNTIGGENDLPESQNGCQDGKYGHHDNQDRKDAYQINKGDHEETQNGHMDDKN